MGFASYVQRLFSGRWIAGPGIADAVSRAKRLNGYGMRVMINYLGEDFGDMPRVRDAVDTYLRVVREIRRHKLRADISLKPTSIGLNVGIRPFMFNLSKIVHYAKANGVFVWLDMEGEAHIDSTIDAYQRLHGSGNLGICIQAYLRRSMRDTEFLVGEGAIIRLVKGAYASNAEHAFRTKREVNQNYEAIMEYLFKRSGRFMIATHDPYMVRRARGLNWRHRRDVQYAVLNGIRNRAALELARNGNAVSVYVPFGTDWVAFSYRRLKERGHLSLVLRSIFEDRGI